MGNNDDSRKGLSNVILALLDDNRAILNSELSGDERRRLSTIKDRCLEFGCTGHYKPPMTRWKRLGLFYHVVFHLPSNHGSCRFQYRESNVIKYQDAIYNLFYKSKTFFDEGQSRIGMFMRPHPQCHDDRMPELHFHMVLSRFKFDWNDRFYMKFFESLPEDDKPFHSLYLLHRPLLFNKQELENVLEDEWRKAVGEVSRKKVAEDQPPLISVRMNTRQDEDDRWDMSLYVNNSPLHTFRDIYIKKSQRKGFAVLEYVKTNRTVSIPIVNFVRRYLLLKNKKLNMRFCPKGPFRNSKFQPIIDAALRLNAKYSNGETESLMDMPAERIAYHANSFRECFNNSDTAGLDRLRESYSFVKCDDNRRSSKRTKS